MLPAYGYLTSFPCPYYVAGLCERPHCLFRHVEKDVLLAYKEASAAILKSSKADEAKDDEPMPTTSKDSKYKVPSTVKQSSLTGSSRKRHDTSTNVYSKYIPSSAGQDVPTYSTTKAYVTPLNHALPLPSSDDQELPVPITSSKRVSVDTAENDSKRRKILEQDIKKEEETITSSNGNTKGYSVVSPQKPSTIVDQPENTSQTKEAVDEKVFAEWGKIIENLAAATRGEISTQKPPVSKEETEKKSSHSSSSSSSSKKEKSSRHENHRSSRTNSSSSSHSHKSKHSEKSKKDESSKDRTKGSSSKDPSKSSSRSSSKKSHKSSSRSSSSSKSPDKKSRSKDQKRRDEKERSSRHIKDEDEKTKLKTMDRTMPPDEFNFPQCDDSDEDPDEVAMECFKMFEDYSVENSKTESKPQNVALSTLSENFSSKLADDDVTFGKKRLAHAGAYRHPVSVSRTNTSAPTPAKTSQQLAKIMLQRMEAAAKEKQEAATSLKQETVSSMKSPPTQHSLMLTKKKRIAHVSNVNMLMKPQNSGQPSNTSESKSQVKSSTNPDMCTIAQTTPKGQSRVAHPPSKILTESSKPLLTIEAASINTKVPVAFRQKILYQLHTELLKWFSESVAAERARKEESEIAGRCSSKMVYFSAATNSITRIRKGCPDDQANSGSLTPQISQSTIGSTGSKVSWSIEGSKKSFRLPVGVKLFQMLEKLVLTEEELSTNGYPMPHPSGEPGRAVSTKTRRGSDHKQSVNGQFNRTSRLCERCSKPYRTDVDGIPILKEKCIHHFGRQFNRKSKGLLERRYTCCDGDLTSEGCCVGETHVSPLPGSEDDLTGFVSAVKEPGDETTMGISIWDIVALDCEMVYTTVGHELARVTIVDCHKDILYDQLVVPPHPVLDYNTRFSGITEEIMLKGPTVSLLQVQAVLLTQLKPNSILIGHSLESDLHALKLMHRHVIDTSILFPHRLGLPYKRALRTLSAEYCGQIIQSSVNGHDSSEDALAALDLVYHKLKELS